MQGVGVSQSSAAAALSILRSIFWAEPVARAARFQADVDVPTLSEDALLLPRRLLDEQIDVPVPQRQVVDLFMPADRVFERIVKLPAATSRRLDDALALDLIRATPFQPGEVHTARTKGRQNGDALSVTQWVVKVRTIDDLRARLAALGVRLRRVWLEGGATVRPFVDFTSEIVPHQKRWQIVNGALVLTIGATLLSQSLFPAIAARRAMSVLERSNVALRQEAVAERRQLDEVAQSSAERAELLAFVLDRPRLLGVLTDLTAALPDDVWISDLTYAGNRMTLAGNTGTSAAGIALSLGENDHFKDARLSGPVARIAEGQERFEITLDLARPAG